jgi:hypothetical protein
MVQHKGKSSHRNAASQPQVLLNPPDERSIVVIRGYFDNSGDENDPQHNVLTLGSYLANEEQWERFELAWKANLDEFELPYLHMKEFAHNLPLFQRFKNDEPERRRFLSNCISIIASCHPHGICHSVRIPDVRRFNAEYGHKIDAFSFCLYTSFIDLRNAYGASNRVELIIDKIEKPYNKIHKAEKYSKTDTFYNNPASTIDTRPLKEPESFINILPMQAADFLVWELRKSTENIDEWYGTRKSGNSGLRKTTDEWLNDLALWNLERHGVLFKERRSFLSLQEAIPSEGVALDYDALVIANKYHPNGWGDS